MATKRELRLARAIEGLSARDMLRLLDSVFLDCGEGFKQQRMVRLLRWSEEVLAEDREEAG